MHAKRTAQKRVTIYPGKPVIDFLHLHTPEGAERPENYSSLFSSSIYRYMELLQQTTPVLCGHEWGLIFYSLKNQNLINTFVIDMLPQILSESVRENNIDSIWDVDRTDFLSKIAAFSVCNRIAVVAQAHRFWSAGIDHRPIDMLKIRMGLPK
ncbi:MAG: hypothetical protein H8E42_05155 [Nitrospinae bacterium]|nr:hypothetical protein [Nitrospinota bacterium]